MNCGVEGCEKSEDRDGLCFRHRIAGTTFGFRGSAREGRAGWNMTANDWKTENFGTSNDKELAARGIERSSNYSSLENR
jgi:hypothetical protein|tara:strand:+ start:1365 stop:1601 length:237 start_codon:yes stop_codon:yes gene_type:complete